MALGSSTSGSSSGSIPTAVCQDCDDCPDLTQSPLSIGSTNAGTYYQDVLLYSGRLNLSYPLLSVPGASNTGSVNFGITYLSDSELDGPFGPGWTHSYDVSLVELADGSIQLNSGATRQIFEWDPVTESYVSDCSQATYDYDGTCVNNTASVLIVMNKGTDNEYFLLTSPDGTQTTFTGFHENESTPGRPTSIASRYAENKLTLSWKVLCDEVALESIKDDYDREWSFDYECCCEDKKLRMSNIKDPTDREVTFTFTDQGHLAGVTFPSIREGAEDNQFPNGTAVAFKTDEKNKRPEMRKNIVEVFAPNQATRYIIPETRQIDIDTLFGRSCCGNNENVPEGDPSITSGSPVPRTTVAYGQDPTDVDQYNKVVQITKGDVSSDVGGTSDIMYTTADLPTNLIDPSDPIVCRTIVTDRNDNQSIYDFNESCMPVHTEVLSTRNKSSLEPGSFTTWVKYNGNNQPVETVNPAGDSIVNEYESGDVSGFSLYPRRRGFLLRSTHKAGNDIGVPSRTGSNGQTELTTRFFYEPLFGELVAAIEERGNPIDDLGTYFTPQNGGSTPTDTDRSRYATINFFDYQKDTTDTVKNDPTLHALLFPDETAVVAAAKIVALIDHVNQQMIDGGLPNGFKMGLGDINGDGTGNGDGSDQPVVGASEATHLGNLVKIQHPTVRQLIPSDGVAPWEWSDQSRVELYTVNNRGQVTSHTDPEGNVHVTMRYPENDPEGDGDLVVANSSNKQYGRVREKHVDVNPFDVMSLVGISGDLVDFLTDVFPRNARTNSKDVYQNLVTRYEGGSAGGNCSSCAYDPLGNPLAKTDPRGFTWQFDRNELGEIYRTIAPAPYEYKVESFFDANRNVIRVDTEDKVVAFKSNDPGSADYSKFTPTGAGNIANIPSKPGAGGGVRPGWFTDIYSFNILDNLTEEDKDATGSNPSSLVTTYEYDANQNLTRITEPEGNTIEFDYDERNLRIATRVGYDDSDPDNLIAGSVSISVFDKNSNVIQEIGPAVRGGPGTSLSVTIADAFGSGSDLAHTGDYVIENTYDGFNRIISTKDALGNVGTKSFDPGNRIVNLGGLGPVGGTNPSNRDGLDNVDLTSEKVRFDEAGRAYEHQHDVFIGLDTQLQRDVIQTGGGLEVNSTTNTHTSSSSLTNNSNQKGLGPVSDSYVLTRTVYDRNGRATFLADDNTGISTIEYDGADRTTRTIDALISPDPTDSSGNVTEFTYDQNGNVVLVKSVERCTILLPSETPVENEEFSTAIRYDALNRPVVAANQGADGTLSTVLSDAGSLFTVVGYDSRGNKTIEIDPKQNTSLSVFDGASRPIESLEHLRINGQGVNGPINDVALNPDSCSTIRSTTTFNGNSLITKVTDDRGAVSTYRYDLQNRPTTMIFPDGSTGVSEYNAASDVVRFVDENGSVFVNTFDPLGRRIFCSITKAPGVVGTDSQSMQFDGLSRMTQAIDTVGLVDAEIISVHDSIGRICEDTQIFQGNSRSTTYTEFTSLVPTVFTYPNNRQTIDSYDLLYRRTQVSESTGGSNIARWEYFGPTRLAECELGNGLICSYMNNSRTESAMQAGRTMPSWGGVGSDRLGYDGAGRTITKRYLSGGINVTTGAYNDSSAIVGMTSEYDQSGNKYFERMLQAESRSDLYQPRGKSTGEINSLGYDSCDRIRQYQRGVLNNDAGGNTGGGEVTTAISLPNSDEARTYSLDGLGNWMDTQFEPVGGNNSNEQRQHNYLNQITRIRENATEMQFSYDGTSGSSNGNLSNDGIRKYEYDAFNRLVSVYKDPNGTPVLIGTYTYDAVGRRVRKSVSNGGLSGGIPNGTVDYIYHKSQCFEERDGSNNATKQYLWGQYVDELVQQRDDPDGAPADFYPLSDLLFCGTAITSNLGAITEVYDCDAYGNTLIFDASGTGGDWWADDATQTDQPTCDFIFTGRRFDSETESYYYRARNYLPSLGRFIQRDPLEYDGSLNLYDYVNNRPTTYTDSKGLLPGDPYSVDGSIIGMYQANWTVAELSALFGGAVVKRTLIQSGVVVGGAAVATQIPGSAAKVDPEKAAQAARALERALAAKAAAAAANSAALAEFLKSIKDRAEEMIETAKEAIDEAIRQCIPCPCWSHVMAIEDAKIMIYTRKSGHGHNWRPGMAPKIRNNLHTALQELDLYNLYIRNGKTAAEAKDLIRRTHGGNHWIKVQDQCRRIAKQMAQLARCVAVPANCPSVQKFMLTLYLGNQGQVIKDCAKMGITI